MASDGTVHRLSMEQRKLVANSTRMKILHALKDVPRTAKQTADYLHQSPGSVHYHIKLLHEGGLLDLVETKANGGVLEKYYQSKTTVFYADEHIPIKGKQVSYAGTQLSLTKDEIQTFMNELNELLGRWESNIRPPANDEKEIAVTCLLNEVADAEE